MSHKPFDGTAQKILALIALGLAMVLIYAAASEAGWIQIADQSAQIEVPKTSSEE